MRKTNRVNSLKQTLFIQKITISKTKKDVHRTFVANKLQNQRESEIHSHEGLEENSATMRYFEFPITFKTVEDSC